MKQHAPSTLRNRDDILGVLEDVLPRSGTILEIASGTGEHAVHFAPRFPDATWQPSDCREEALASIRAWARETAVPNVADPLRLDVTDAGWPVERADAIVTINMLHVSPWGTCEAWLAGAARTLVDGAPLYYYGAFFRADRETAPSNLAFDESLRERDPSWGVRRLERVLEVARSHGLEIDRTVDMPNNNTSVVWRRGPAR